MTKTFHSTYELLAHFCSIGSVEIRFYQRDSSAMFPVLNFGSPEVQSQLHANIFIWFTSGDGAMPWNDVCLVFNHEDDELSFRFTEAILDEEYYADWDENFDEYLLDVQALKDGKKYEPTDD